MSPGRHPSSPVRIDAQGAPLGALPDEGELNLQLIVDTIPSLVWSAWPNGEMEFLNKYYTDYIGVAANDRSRFDWQRAIHPDDLAGVEAAWKGALSSGVFTDTEARLRRADGQYRWFLFRANPLRNEEGLIVRWYGVNTDIDDRRRAEQQSRRNEAFLNQAQRLTRTGSLWLDAPTRKIFWSDESYRLMELPKSADPSVELIASRCHPDDLSPWQVQVDAIFQGDDVDFEHRLVMSDGRVKHVHVVMQNLGAKDEPEFVGAVTDITERKRVENELRQTSHHLNEAQRLSRSGSFTVDIPNDVHVWSDEFYRICEFEVGSQITHQRVRSMVHPEDRRSFYAAMERAAAGEQFSFRIVTPSGAIKHLQAVAYPLAEGPVLVGAVHDVTEQRRAEEEVDRVRSELTHASRAMTLGVLTASIAHEINQPLSGILMNASTCLRMLALNPPNIEEAEDAARLALRDGNRASEVTARLRTLFSKKKADLAPLDLAMAVREVLALSRRELERRDIALEVRLADKLPQVCADRVQLQQVILNLLLNASESMMNIEGRPRHLFLETREAASGVELSVKDAGVGIAPEAFTRLFDPFYTTKPDGMGIGLSVSRSIIERHGGRLWASNNDDFGVTFHFSLPCVPAGDAQLSKGQE